MYTVYPENDDPASGAPHFDGKRRQEFLHIPFPKSAFTTQETNPK